MHALINNGKQFIASTEKLSTDNTVTIVAKKHPEWIVSEELLMLMWLQQ